MTAQHWTRLPSIYLPQAHSLINTTRGQPPAIYAETYTHNQIRMTAQHRTRLPSIYLPQAYSLVNTARDQALAITAESHTGNIICMPAQSLNMSLGEGIIEFNVTISCNC